MRVNLYLLVFFISWSCSSGDDITNVSDKALRKNTENSSEARTESPTVRKNSGNAPAIIPKQNDDSQSTEVSQTPEDDDSQVASSNSSEIVVGEDLIIINDNVVLGNLSDFRISPSKSVRAGDSFQFVATATDIDGNEVDLTEQVSWSSSDDLGQFSLANKGEFRTSLAGSTEISAELSGVFATEAFTIVPGISMSPCLKEVIKTPRYSSQVMLPSRAEPGAAICVFTLENVKADEAISDANFVTGSIDLVYTTREIRDIMNQGNPDFKSVEVEVCVRHKWVPAKTVKYQEQVLRVAIDSVGVNANMDFTTTMQFDKSSNVEAEDMTGTEGATGSLPPSFSDNLESCEDLR